MARRTSARIVLGTVRRRRSSLLRSTALQAATLVVFATQPHAQPAPNARPTGGNVVAGAASIGQSATTTTINQSSQRAAIDWRSFDVGSNQTVQFQQPNASAVTLNRVTGPDPSAIAGRLTANGGIIITNPSGVMFSKGAQVDAANLVVSAPGISNRNFMAGRMVFDQAPKPNARVSNAGTITVKQTGLAALVAPSVANSGTINARLGRVVLAGAEAHTIDLYGDGLLAIDVTKQVTQVPLGPDGKPVTALVTNTGTVVADGGVVQITARAADGIVQNLVDAGGRIQANTASGHAGLVAIDGVGGSVQVSGRVLANGGAAGPGGQIAINASDTVALTPTARLHANGAGGGTVALGTTLARAAAGRAVAFNPSLPPAGIPQGTARRVMVAQGAVVSANGRGAGVGGTVVALSTDTTDLAGQLQARGGPSGGAGGAIEASSAGTLSLATATLDVSAPHGAGGAILLDPFNLTIQQGGSFTLNHSSPPQIAAGDPPSTGTSFLDPFAIESASMGGASLIRIEATNDLVVNSPINLALGIGSPASGTSGASLSLHAGHDLTVLANITTGTSNGDTTPTLTLDAGHQIFVGPDLGGAVTLSGHGDITLTTVGASADQLSSSITLHPGSTISTDGAVLLQATNRIDMGSGVRIAAGPNNSQTTQQAGIDLVAGLDITMSTNVTVAVLATDGSVQPHVGINAGRDVTLLANGALIDGGGFGSTVQIASGSSLPHALISVAAAPDVTGSVTIGGGMTVKGGSVSISSGSQGNVLLANGSSVQGGTGGISIASGAGGTSIGGTLDAGATSIVLSSSGDVSETGSGALLAGGLVGNANSYTLTSPSNRITGIGTTFEGETLAATGGDVRLVDSVSLVLGAVGASPGGGIAVRSGGTISLTTDSLTINAGNVMPNADLGLVPFTLYAPSGTVAIQPFTPGTQVELQNGAKTQGVLSVTQDELSRVSAATLQLGSSNAGALAVGPGGATVNLTASGLVELDLLSHDAISQGVGGAIVVQTLAASGGSVALTEPGNQIVQLGASGSTATDFALTTATTPLTLLSTVSVPSGRTLTLQADQLAYREGAALSAPGGTVILEPLAQGTQITLSQFIPTNPPVTADTLRIGSASAGALLVDGDYTFSGVNTLDLRAQGAITEEGSLAALRLTGQAGSAALDGNNLIGTLAGFTTAAGFALTNHQTLTLTGPVRDGSAISLDVNGDLLLQGDLSAPSVTLAATGSITQTGGSVAAGLLTGHANASATLTSTVNQIDTLGPFTTGTSFALLDARSLTVVGTLDPPDIALGVVGDLTITQPIIGNTVDLIATGAITESGEGAISAAQLTGSAATATLTGANTIATLAGFATQTGFSLFTNSALAVAGPVTDSSAITLASSGPITIAGNVTAPDVTLSTDCGCASVGSGSAGFLQTSGAIVATGTLRLDINGAIAQSGGTIAAGTLTGSGFADTFLTQPNSIQAITDFDGGGRFALRTTVDLVQSGTLSSVSDTTLSVAGALQLTGTLHSTALELVTTGAITQPSGAIQTGQLTGTAGSAALGQPGNTVGQLGIFSSAGDFAFADGAPLTVTGHVSVGTGQTLSLTSDQIALTEGSLAAPSGTVALAPLTPGAAFSLAHFVLSPNSFVADTLRIGSASAGDIAVDGTFSFANVSTLDLRSGGAIAETEGSSLTVARLQGQAQTATLDGPNAIGTLAGFTTSTGFVLSNAQALTVAGPVQDGASIAITTNGTLTIAGNITAPAIALTANAGSVAINPGVIAQSQGTIAASGTLTLNAANSVSQSGGTIVAGQLTVSAPSVSLTAAGNAIGVLGDVTGQLFSLTNARSLTVAGAVSSAQEATFAVNGDLTLAGTLDPQFLSLAVTGAVSQPSGSVQLLSVSGTAGSLALNQPTNSINGLSSGLTTAGDLSLVSGGSMFVGAPVAAGQGHTISLAAPSLKLNSGATLSAPGGTVALLPETDAVFSVSSAAASGAITAGRLQIGSASAGDLSLSGTFGTPGTLDLRSGGTITLSAGGTLQAGTLTGQASSASLGSIPTSGSVAATNAIGTLGSFNVSGAFTLADGTGLVVTGPVNASTLFLGSTGPVQFAGNVTAGLLGVVAGGAVTQTAGTLTAGTLTGTAVGLAQFGGRGGTAAVGTLGSMVLTGSTLTLVDSVPLTVTGPLVAGAIQLSAPGRLTLQGGQIITGNAGFAVTPGQGATLLQQTGTTQITTPSGTAGTLTLSLPGSGGSLALTNLIAPTMNVTLNLGSGSATGTLNAANLDVIGAGGSAALSGQVAGQTGFGAAAIATISPGINAAYQFNLCTIGTACGAVVVPPTEPAAPVVPAPVVEPAIASLFPKSFAESVLGSILRPNLFTIDLITIGIARDPTDPELILPNISDRDY